MANGDSIVELLERERSDLLEQAERVGRAIAAYRGGVRLKQVTRKGKRKAKTPTPTKTQRAIEVFCYWQLVDAREGRLESATLHALIARDFGGTRSVSAVDQMLTVCPYFVRLDGRCEGWRVATAEEWTLAAAEAHERGWPGPDELPELTAA